MAVSRPTSPLVLSPSLPLPLLLLLLLTLATRLVSAGLLDSVTDAGNTSTSALFYAGPGTTSPLGLNVRAGNSDFNFDASFSVMDAFTLDFSSFASGGTLTPTLITDGTSRHDPNTVSCGSSMECVAVSAGKYILMTAASS